MKQQQGKEKPNQKTIICIRDEKVKTTAVKKQLEKFQNLKKHKGEKTLHVMSISLAQNGSH